MPPRRRAPAPVPIDVAELRRKLADGKIVRAAISKSAQFPDGGTGRVRAIGDPDIDGEEFIQVELSLNGTKDILPFTPADLAPVTRGRPPKAEPDAPATSRSRGRPRKAETDASATSVTGGRTAATTSSAANPGPAATRDAAHGAGARPEGGGPSTQPAPTNSSRDQTDQSAVNQPGFFESPAPAIASTAAVPAGTRKAPRGARRPPAVSISIATTDADPPQWRLEARVGTRVALRAGSVTPARVWDLVRLLDDDSLTRAVSSILDEQRNAAQARAAALTAELAQVRAELDALPNRTS